MNLSRLYFSYGLFNLALEELEKALKCPHETAAVTHFKEWECNLPSLTVSIYNKIFESSNTYPAPREKEMLSSGLLKFLIMTVSKHVTMSLCFTLITLLCIFYIFYLLHGIRHFYLLYDLPLYMLRMLILIYASSHIHTHPLHLIYAYIINII